MELSLTRKGCGGSLGGTTGLSGTTGLTGKSSRILSKAFASIVVRSAFGIPSAVKCSWAESGSGLLLCYYDMKNK